MNLKAYFFVILVGCTCMFIVASLMFLKSEHIYHFMNGDLQFNYNETIFKPQFIEFKHMLDRVFSSNEDNKSQHSKIKIGVLIPTTSRGRKIDDIKSFSLVNISIRSLNETMESRYKYTIYAGVDVNDSLIKYHDYIETLPGPFNVVMVPVNGRTFTRAVNVIAEKAIKDGMDYLLRINDDIKFVTYNWTSICIESLKNNDPPNIGVVGPTCRQGNTAIMTTDFVHVTHYHIFGFYYPPPLDNWWTDDWMTRVYKPQRSKRLSTWEVIHKMSYGQRYKVDMKQLSKLENLIKYGNKTVTSYVNKQLGHV